MRDNLMQWTFAKCGRKEKNGGKQTLGRDGGSLTVHMERYELSARALCTIKCSWTRAWPLARKVFHLACLNIVPCESSLCHIRFWTCCSRLFVAEYLERFFLFALSFSFLNSIVSMDAHAQIVIHVLILPRYTCEWST
jgi:hypothetical protein